jgi:hypothetical protein
MAYLSKVSQRCGRIDYPARRSFKQPDPGIHHHAGSPVSFRADGKLTKFAADWAAGRVPPQRPRSCRPIHRVEAPARRIPESSRRST